MVAATLCPPDVPNCSGLLDVNLTLPVELALFLLTVFVLWRLVWRPIIEILERRDQRLAAGAHAGAEAERLYAAGLAEVQSRLDRARGEARDVIAGAYRTANAAAEDVRAAATREARALTDAALDEIGHESRAAVGSLRTQAEQLAVAAAGRLLNTPLDEQRYAPLARAGQR